MGMSVHEAVVEAVVPKIYAYALSLEEPGVGLYNDMSHGRKCSKFI